MRGCVVQLNLDNALQQWSCDWAGEMEEVVTLWILYNMQEETAASS